MYKKILVPLDGSSFAEASLPHAIELSRLMSAELVLVSVRENFDYYMSDDYIAPDPAIMLEMQSMMSKETDNYLHRILKDLSSQHVSVSCKLLEGGVVETLLGFAREVGADLIVLSSHGRSGLEKWLLGSTADRIVHASRIPVLVVRPSE